MSDAKKLLSINTFASIALATASATTIAYYFFCYREFDENYNNQSYAWSILQRHRQRKHKCITCIKPPLRNVTPRPGEQPQIVYLTGIHRQTSEEEIFELLSLGGTSPIELDLSEVSFQKGGGRAWAMYRNAKDAKRTIEQLQSKIVRGCVLCARLEWGVTLDGKRITDKTTHTAILRGIQRRRGTPKKKTKESKKKKKEQRMLVEKEKGEFIRTIDATYSHKSILIGEIEYPFPSGIYLSKLIQKLSKTNNDPSEKKYKDHHQQKQQDEDLLRLLSDISILGCGSVHRYVKELSEVFAMVDAVERAIKLNFGISTGDMQHPVICYCLGDGKYPIGAAALILFLPISRNEKNWKFIAIDPLLPKQDTSESAASQAKATIATSKINATSMLYDRIEIFSGLSQDYCIEKRTNYPSKLSPSLSIIVACHSHAPLEEFWERIPSPKLCVAMPCCAQFSELPKETPIFEYDNYEVYSPKRRIKIFASQ